MKSPASFRHLRPGGKDYLVIAAMPTPNGRLHLGHMSGPYLKVDVITRALRRNGNRAVLISGCDGYESYVTLKAWETGQSPEEVCHHYSQLALKDLQALDIHYDGYINPLDPQFREDFVAFGQGCLQALVDDGLVENRPEKVLYSPSGKRYLVGCWLLGKCPNCGSGAGSYQCEDCGTQFRPMDMVEPHSRAGDTDLVELEDRTLYLKIQKKDALRNWIARMGIPKVFPQIVEDYFDLQGDYIRLTNPDLYGIPFEVEGSPTDQVIYTATYMNCFMVYMGQLYQELTGAEGNPFDLDSEVTTMVSFGIDCSIPYILGMSWAIESDHFKPVDYLLPNYFCQLGNSKFSTSRNHAIWGADIVEQTSASSDAVRFYLAKVNPEHRVTSFLVEEFVETNNGYLSGAVGSLLLRQWLQLEESSCEIPADFPLEELEMLLIRQGEDLCPPDFRMARGLEPLQEWIRRGAGLPEAPATAYAWLKGFALLAWPYMPACASSLWQLLGMQGNPEEAAFFAPSQPQRGLPLPHYFPTVSLEEMQAILPPHLRKVKI